MRERKLQRLEMSCSQIAPKLLGSKNLKACLCQSNNSLCTRFFSWLHRPFRKSGESYRSDVSRRLPFVTAERWYMQSAPALSFGKRPHAWSNNSIRFLRDRTRIAEHRASSSSSAKKNNQNKTNANMDIKKKESTRQDKTYKEALMTDEQWGRSRAS